jgi:hypothetical protein
MVAMPFFRGRLLSALIVGLLVDNGPDTNLPQGLIFLHGLKVGGLHHEISSW